MKNEIEKFRVDVKANRILKFDESWYQVELNGTQHDLISITTVLSRAYPMNPSLLAWIKKNGENADILRDEAGKEGSSVHRIIELALKGNEVSFENEDGSRNYTIVEWEKFCFWCAWYKDARQTIDLQPLYVEQIVYDIEEGIAGTIDLIAETSSGRQIYDWKTGHIGTGEVQVSKYLTMANKMKFFGEIKHANIVQLGATLNKNGWRVTNIKYPELLSDIFDSVLKLFNRVYPELQPKYKTFPNKTSLQFIEKEETTWVH